MITIRPATIADVLEYAGELPVVRIRAWVGDLDGTVIGVGGLAYLPNGHALAFLNIDDDVRAHARVSLYKAAKTAIGWALDHGLTQINAIKSDDIEAAERFLVRLGFEAAGAGIFIYKGRC